LSIVQLDPPRFKIQVVQEADRAFARLDTQQAISLYQQALTNTDLRYWLNDEPNILNTYIYYRLVLMYAYIEDDELLATYQAALQSAPDPTNQPVYIPMLDAFWNSLQVTHNLHSACIEVQAIITARPEALELLNRYGSRSPTYTASNLCPF
jgi:tetratricopeptide (TPR) repeat protein